MNKKSKNVLKCFKIIGKLSVMMPKHSPKVIRLIWKKVKILNF